MKRIRFAGRMIMIFIVPFVFACASEESPSLPPVGFKVEFGEHNIPAEMAVGQTQYADISVRNISERTWPNKPNHEGLNAVNLSYHWIDRKGRTVVFDGLRTPLPRELSPGEMLRLHAAIQAPNHQGRYTLEVTMVQEGVAWFPEMDGAKLVVPVNVVSDQTEFSTDTGQEPRSPAQTRKNKDTENPRPKGGNKPSLEKRNATKVPVQKSSNQDTTVEVEKVTNKRMPGSELWSVQVGSYAEDNEARGLAKTLANKGYDTYVVIAQVKGKNWHRVQVGRLATETEAKKLQQILRTVEGLKQSFITRSQ